MTDSKPHKGREIEVKIVPGTEEKLAEAFATKSNQHSRPDIDALREQCLGMPSNVTMAHDFLDVLAYVRSLEEQLQAVERERDYFRDRLPDFSKVQQDEFARAERLQEQLETAQDALDRIADSKKHDEAHEGYCGWCHLIDIARAANDRYPASSYGSLVEPPEADSDVCHNDAQSPATEPEAS